MGDRCNCLIMTLFEVSLAAEVASVTFGSILTPWKYKNATFTLVWTLKTSEAITSPKVTSEWLNIKVTAREIAFHWRGTCALLHVMAFMTIIFTQLEISGQIRVSSKSSLWSFPHLLYGSVLSVAKQGVFNRWMCWGVMTCELLSP